MSGKQFDKLDSYLLIGGDTAEATNQTWKKKGVKNQQPDAKRTQNRTDLRKKLAALPEDIRKKYRLWRKKAYRAVLKCDRTGKRVDVFLYGKVDGTKVLPYEIGQVTDLLHLSGQLRRWAVVIGWKEVEHGYYMSVTLTVYPKFL